MSRFFRRRHTDASAAPPPHSFFGQLSLRLTDAMSRFFRRLSLRHTDATATATEISIIVLNRGFPSLIVSASRLGTLKSRIMERFNLTKEDLKQRMLVTDSRDLTDLRIPAFPILDDCQDLLESDDGSSLISLGVKDGDQLRLVMKRPFNIRVLTRAYRSIEPFVEHEICNLKPYDTVGKLKKKIRKATGEIDNLPLEFFSPGVDKRPILSLGFFCLCDCYGTSSFFTILKRTQVPEDQLPFKYGKQTEVHYA